MFNFTNTYRLTNKQDFQSVFSKSSKITGKYLLVLHCTNQLKHPRLGIIISKRYAKTAVTRNSIKRLIRENFRQQKNLLKGLDIIVLMRSEWTFLDGNKALRDDIDKLWQLLTHC